MATAAGSFSTTKSNRRSRRKTEQTSLVAGTIRATELLCNACLLVIVFAVPLLMAGRRETGVALFVGCSLVMGTAWATRQLVAPQTGSSFTFAVVLAALAVSLVGLQLTPLPQWVLQRLSPFSKEFLPVWNGTHSLLKNAEYWPTLSMTPSLTRSGFVLLIAYVVFFLTLLQRIKTTDCIDGILRLMAVATVVMAVIGMAQMLTGSEYFLGVIDHPLRSAAWPAKGTFTNQNHFAHFLALGIGPLVWCWKQAAPIKDEIIRGRVINSGFGQSRNIVKYQQYIGATIAVVALAGLLSFSRGGIVSVLIAVAIVFASLGRHWAAILKLGMPIVAFLVVGMAVFGTEILESKWNRLTGASSLEELCRGRFLLWSALLKATPHFWPFGAGVGSHAEVYPTWMSVDIGKRLSHAESGYFQVLIETGVSGLLLALAAIVLCVGWFSRTWGRTEGNERLRLVVVSSGLFVSFLHSLMDFVWYIPACMIFTLVLAACLCRLYQLKSGIVTSGQTQETTSTWPASWAMIIVLIIVPVGRLSANQVLRDAETEPAWLAYRSQSIAAGEDQSYDSMDSLSDRLGEIIQHLEQCVQINPENYLAKTALATMYLHRFESNQAVASNPMTTQEIKQTVYTADFESPREILNWLQKAFGSNSVDLYRSFALARQAVHGQPLRAENYLVLAQLGFLSGASASDSDALIEQAAQLRPFEPSVLYMAGVKEAEKNDLSGACKPWKQAFHLSREIRPTIIRSLAASLSPEEIIKRIEPDGNGLWSLMQHYKSRNESEPRKFIAEWYTHHFSEISDQTNVEDSNFWLRSSEIFQFVGAKREAAYCLTQAAEKQPNQYQLRKQCALGLLELGATKAARKELKWCELRNPDDPEITDGLAAIAKAPRREVSHESK